MKVWRPCGKCNGAGGWMAEAERGRLVFVLCSGCDGAKGEYVNVYE